MCFFLSELLSNESGYGILPQTSYLMQLTWMELPHFPLEWVCIYAMLLTLNDEQHRKW